MREIKFRGRTLKDGVWVYGFVSMISMGVAQIWYEVEEKCSVCLKGIIVYPSTVGQYTGLKDKNGKEIYEGDLLYARQELIGAISNKPSGRFDETTKCVFWAISGWETRVIKSDSIVVGSTSKFLEITAKYFEVIGNIHDNPELLEVQCGK